MDQYLTQNCLFLTVLYGVQTLLQKTPLSMLPPPLPVSFFSIQFSSSFSLPIIPENFHPRALVCSTRMSSTYHYTAIVQRGNHKEK